MVVSVLLGAFLFLFVAEAVPFAEYREKRQENGVVDPVLVSDAEDTTEISQLEFARDAEDTTEINQMEFVPDAEDTTEISHMEFARDAEYTTEISQLGFARDAEDTTEISQLEFIPDAEDTTEISQIEFAREVSGNIAKRIIGGTRVHNRRLMPAAVSITTEFTLDSHQYTIHCGGSLVTSRWVLTAAHCLTYPETTQLVGGGSTVRLYIGGLEVENAPEARHGMELILHPDFTETDIWNNDLAMILLNQPVDFVTDEIENAGILTEVEWPNGDLTCKITGWGCNHTGADGQEYIHWAQMPLVSNQACQDYYGISTVNRFCAGASEESNVAVGVCKGDSGGGVYCSKDGNWHLAGVTSFTNKNAADSSPAVFTRVSGYTEWLISVVNASK